MRVFTKHTKVIGVTKHELDALAGMIREASATGKSEWKMAEAEYLAIEVGDNYDMHRPGAGERGCPLPPARK